MDGGAVVAPTAASVLEREIVGCRFSFYSSAALRAASVKAVTSSHLLDALNQPVAHGLYDQAMGPIDAYHRCVTCDLQFKDCPGHLGHIELQVPVFNPLLYPLAVELLRAHCPHCDLLRLPRARAEALVAAHALIDAGLLVDAANVAAAVDFKGAADELGGAAAAADGDDGDDDDDGGGGGGGGGVSVAPSAAPRADGVVGLPNGVPLSAEAVHFLRLSPAARTRAAAAAAARAPSLATSHSVELRAELKKKWSGALHADKCYECGWHAAKLKSEGVGKLFVLPLPAKLAKRNEATRQQERASGVRRARATGGGDGESSDDEEGADEPGDDAGGAASRAAGDAAVAAAKPHGVAARNFLAPSEAAKRLTRLWAAERPLLRALFPGVSPAVLTLTAAPVPPSRFRQPLRLGEELVEHPQNVYLVRILAANTAVRELLAKVAHEHSHGHAHAQADANAADALRAQRAAGSLVAARVLEGARDTSSMAALLTRWQALQLAVNCVFDSTLGGGTGGAAALSEPPGVKQLLERKEGLFRMHMMGKRVNFAARSVISPDPYISTGEIGVPLHFAKTLTFAEPVNAWNVEQLRQAVVNGAETHPGANYVQTESGEMVDLSRRSLKQRQALAKTLGVVDARTAAAPALALGMLGGGNGGNGGGLIGGAAGGEHGGGGGAGLAGTLPPKRVLRHLVTGDVLLVNRQPTLHKPGMMAHTAIVLSAERVIRMHYANCNTYNADFDGDEINLHFPQSQLARAEAYGIAATAQQYTVPTSGKPLRGLIQDHVIAGMLLTKRDTFLTFAEMCQLLHCAAPREPSLPPLPPPALLKPTRLWTGKQLASCVLLLGSPLCTCLNLDGKSKVAADAWGWRYAPRDPLNGRVLRAPQKGECEEGELVVRGGELLVGLLDKAAFGASEFGVVHAVQELAGPDAAARLLTALGRVLTACLQLHAFTCCISNFALRADAEAARAQQLAAAEPNAQAALSALLQAYAQASAAAGGAALAGDGRPPPTGAGVRGAMRARFAAAHAVGEPWHARVDGALKAAVAPVTSAVQGACLPQGQRVPFPHNAFAAMVTTGAKGSLVNFLQISCALGQQELEGRRVPLTPAGRSAPWAAPYELGARAGGYITDRFLTGVTPGCYYFHCMSGREGLVDTAVKTSRSGYLQRCLVKHLEGLALGYDHTVRGADGGVVQFVYGEDGLDPTKTSWLGSEQTLPFFAHNGPALDRQYRAAHPPVCGRALGKAKDVLRTRQAVSAAGETLLSRHLPKLVCGAVSDAFAQRVEAFAARALKKAAAGGGRAKGGGGDDDDEGGKDKEKSGGWRLTKHAFAQLLCTKYLRSLAPPGEAVGLLAAQSVGEPSTQMTLNTFHLAGVGGGNVTLGIPRMREILMVASRSPATPLMTMPLRASAAQPSVDGDCGSDLGTAKARELAAALKRVTLGQLAAQITAVAQLLPADVDATPTFGDAAAALGRGGGGANGQYTCAHRVTIDLAPLGAHTPPALVLQAFRHGFVPALDAHIDKALRKQGEALADIRVVAGGTHADTDADADGGRGADAPGEGGARGTRGTRGKAAKAPKAKAAAAAADDDDGDAAGGVSAAAVDVLGDDDDEPEGAEDADADDARETARLFQRGGGASYGGPSADDEDALGATERPVRVATADGDDDDDEGGAADARARKDKGGGSAAYAKYVRACGDELSAAGCVRLWLLVHLPPRAHMLLAAAAREVSDGVEVRATVRIADAFVVPGKQGALCSVQTAGVNFGVLARLNEWIDPNKVMCNDIWAVRNMYGVEAARACLVGEVRGVFGAYGIAVDARHLSLIADYMTHEGGYKPLSRLGIAASTSPLLKMSFETTVGFLTAAAIAAERDTLSSPAASIVVGKPVRVGTGAFDLLHPLPPIGVPS